MHDPRKNRGTAFTQKQRDKYGLREILPDAVETIETQALRVSEQLGNPGLPIEKYVYLMSGLDTNETLFFKTVISRPLSFPPPVCTDGWGSVPAAGPHRTATPGAVQVD